MTVMLIFKCAADIFQKVCRSIQAKVGMQSLNCRSTTTVRVSVLFFCLLQTGESLVSLGERANRHLTLSLSQSIHLQAQGYGAKCRSLVKCAAL